MQEYNPRLIEDKWQRDWERQGVFQAHEGGDKVYVLEMFPYPSGRIHMGHVRNYTIGDALARYLMLKKRNVLHPHVLHPMGWDAFGLPAENAAIKHGVHPAKWTYENIDYMRKQLKLLGFSYDWEREIATCDPEYYRWNQWIFLKMYERGLVYRKTAEVNWCPNDETVLANEQVIDGKCWRCGTPIVRKEVPSWYISITAYAERLLEDLKELEGLWPERVIAQQRNWIGRSEGTLVRFDVDGVVVEVFTTRADTLFGATFLALAPEHPLTLELAKRGGREREREVRGFIGRMKSLSTRERGTLEEKEGVFLGVYATNPVNGERIPVWSVNYVLYEYGTGAIMAVPAHDQRDMEFAQKYSLPIKVVVKPPSEHDWSKAYEGEGVLINSGAFSGLDSQTAKKEITLWLKERGLGDFRITYRLRDITYRLRDWNVSRQRYWGTPIPMVHCPRCGVVPVPEEELPVLLPMNVEITGHGNPLTFFDSSWYFLRFCDPKNDKEPFARERVDHWLPVDVYIGGIEHAVLHLLYARFFQKFLYDLGLVKDKEPFKRLITQGMVLKRWLSIGSLLSALGVSLEEPLEELVDRIKEVRNEQRV